MTEKNPFSKYAQHLSLGAEIAVGLTAPIFIGYWLDSYFGISPWLLLTGCAVGVVNFFILIFQLDKRHKNQ